MVLFRAGRRRLCVLFLLRSEKPGWNGKKVNNISIFFGHPFAERLHAAHGGGAPEPFQGAVQEMA